jgi:hypothetical protein
MARKEAIYSLKGGEVFNELTFIRYVGKHHGNEMGEFRCSCGVVSEKVVSNVIRGEVKSCGHLSTNKRQFKQRVVEKKKEGYFSFDDFDNVIV